MSETPGKGAVQRALEWALGDTEPVRRALYGVIVPGVALLVGYGLLSDERAPLWIALGVAILGPTATETARSIAWAPRAVASYGDRWQAGLEVEYHRGVTDALAGTPDVVDEVGQHAPLAERVAPNRASRCHEVTEGRRCVLLNDHRGEHLMRL